MWSGRGRALRIALYDCEPQLPQLLPAISSDSSYAGLLQAAIDHVLPKIKPQSTSSLTLTKFDATAQEYPSSAASQFDGVLISGSLSAVYDRKPWIRRLLREIELLDKNKVRTCGISFGHQAIAAALGATVASNPKGSEVSVREAQLTDKGRQIFSTDKRSYKLHYHHNDAILELPPGDQFCVLAFNNLTQYQALFKPHHFLTFCGHPDYSHQPQVLESLLEHDRKMGWVGDEAIRQGLKVINDQTDYEWIVQQMVRFYTVGLEYPGFASDGPLLTSKL